MPNIKQNIHESIYDIVYNMDKITPPENVQNEETKASVEYILNLGPEEPSQYTDVSHLVPLTLTYISVTFRNISIM